MNAFQKLRQKAREIKSQVYVLYYAARHPRTPWYAKALIAAVVAYALSPIDLIPDFVPVLGYLDDVILLPLGITLALKLISHDVLAECAEQARQTQEKTSKSWKAAVVLVTIWLVVAVVIVKVVWGMVG